MLQIWIESCIKDLSTGQSDVCILCIFRKEIDKGIVALSQHYTGSKDLSHLTCSIEGYLKSPGCDGAYLVESSGFDKIGRKGTSSIFRHRRPGWVLPIQVQKSNSSVSIRGLPRPLDWIEGG